MARDFIQVDEQDGALTLTMDDARTRNAMGPDISNEINEELDRLESDSDPRVLVLTGKDPAFCSRANVRWFSQTIEEREAAAETTAGSATRG